MVTCTREALFGTDDRKTVRRMKHAGWLLPLLLVYVVIIILYAHAGHELRVDEGRYVSLGTQLAKGGSVPTPVATNSQVSAC